MNLRILIPSGISSLRIVLAPLLAYTFINDLKVWAISLFLLAVLTDILDGYLARKLNASSNFGAYLDTFADFILILTAFSAFVNKGLYPFWILILIVFMFLQFILTSGLKMPIYDPLGKYYGSLLFAGVGITLLFPVNTICNILLVIIVVFSIISLINRLLFIIRRKTIYFKN